MKTKDKFICTCGHDKFDLVGFMKMSKNRGDLREIQCRKCNKKHTI